MTEKLKNTEKNIKKLVRTFNIGNDSVVLKDTYTSDKKHDIKERFVTEIEPVISDDGVRLGNLLMKTTKTPSVSSVSLRNHNLEYETFYAIDFQVDADEFEIVFVIE